MMKKFALTAGLVLGIFTGSAAAQEVTVEGFGVDRDGAIRDAARMAVEQVAGSYIDSRTLVENFLLQLDEVYQNAAGFVSSLKILSESDDNGAYRVRARVNVDTNPNSALIDRLTMIMQLNDPRITVAAFSSAEASARNETVEGYLTEALVNSGFSHVLDLDSLILKENIDEASLVHGEKIPSLGADYLIFCKCNQAANQSKISTHGETGTQLAATNFYKATANLRVDVIRCDTGEIVGTFAASGKAMELGQTPAQNAAIENAAQTAAENLVRTFKKLSASVTQSLAFKIIAPDTAAAEEIIAALRNIGKIDSVRIRELSGGTAILSVDTSQRPHEIVAALKTRTSRDFSVESLTNSSCILRVN